MNKNLSILFFIGTVLAMNYSVAQSSRTERTINDGWKFLNDGIAFGQNKNLVDDTSWETINVPHTWNAKDPFDAQKSYRRGNAWYRKTIAISEEDRSDKLFYLHFEGVNQVADVFINGIHIGRHKGGYTAFTFDITAALEEGEEQLIAVMVNNAHDPFIAPLSVGFALYGGIYRDVWLVSTNKVHFQMDDYGSKGIFISTPLVNNSAATIEINGTLVNENAYAENVSVKSTIYDVDHNEVTTAVAEIQLNSEEKNSFKQNLSLSNPKLWSPDTPYLYTVKTEISSDGKILDVLKNPLGLRWFSFDANTGFSLNGKHLKLRGTNRHQDKEGKGSALTNAEHRRDMELIKAMGANFIRIAHYPQDPEILKAADELGLLAWEEVPLVNYMTIDQEFLDNSINMLKEMIRQHYNHPSVVIWGSMNEIFLWGNNEDRISKQNDSVYKRDVAKYAKILDATIREEDPNRYSVLAMHQSKDYDAVGIEDIPQISAYNIYSGWYGGKLPDFGGWMDQKHEAKPNQVLFISEYGAGSDFRLNSDDPKRFDFTGQYQRLFNESYIEQVEEREFVSGSAIWNQFDFSQPHVGGSMPHLNQKGMATWDRKPKDVYYLFQANWSKEPMLHIAEKDWPVRAITSASKKYTLTVYSNLPKVSLYVDGKKIGTEKVNKLHKAQFEVSLKPGDNLIKAVATENGNTLKDVTNILIQRYNGNTQPNLFINVGSNAQYFDPASNTAWLEDRPFEGFYGYAGGEETQVNRKYIFRSGLHDPLFYTSLEGIDSYKIKAKNGSYKLTLYFMESEDLKAGERVFDVGISGNKVITNLDLVDEFGFCYGIAKTFQIEITDGQLLLDFKASSGKTTLSGLELLKTN